jgi:hypothetical protein
LVLEYLGQGSHEQDQSEGKADKPNAPQGIADGLRMSCTGRGQEDG